MAAYFLDCRAAEAVADFENGVAQENQDVIEW